MSDVSFYHRVSNAELTKKESLVAQYLLDNRTKAGFMTASGIARELDVSDVTVIRFSRKLGYTGFTDLLEALQGEILEQLDLSDRHVLIPQNRLDHAMEDSKGRGLLQMAVDGLVENLCFLTKKNSDEVFARAASLIYSSRHKIVAGFRGSASTADSFAARLSYLLDDVCAVLHSDPSDYGRIFNLRKGDCLIVIGFEDYQESLVSLVRRAQKNGVSLVAITDKETSPLAFQSDVCIYCSIAGISFNSFCPVLLALEVVSANLVQLVGQAGEIRNQALLEHMESSGYFWNK